MNKKPSLSHNLTSMKAALNGRERRKSVVIIDSCSPVYLLSSGWSRHAQTAEDIHLFFCFFFIYLQSDIIFKRFHTLSFLLALNFFRHSTVSCLCIMEATVERCCGETEKERERERERERKKAENKTSERREALTVTGLCGQELSEILAFLQMCWFWGSLGDDIFGKKTKKNPGAEYIQLGFMSSWQSSALCIVILFYNTVCDRTYDRGEAAGRGRIQLWNVVEEEFRSFIQRSDV